MEFTIRSAALPDLPFVYHICHKTAHSGQDAEGLLSDQYIVGQYFAAPYLHYEIDSCFIVEYRSIPVGYILGALDTQKFNEIMNNSWLPHLRKFYPANMKPISELEKFLIDIIHKDCKFPTYLADYPSHLHIDLLPVAQGKGYGKKLIFTLFDSLRQRGSKGIHLAVGENNLNAIEFYKKLSFEEFKREQGSVVMVFDFNKYTPGS